MTAPAEAISILNSQKLSMERKRELLQELVNKHPGEADVWSAYGEVLEAAGNDAVALAAFEKAVELDPNSYTPWLWIGILSKRGTPEPDLKRAEQAFRRAITEGAPKPRALNELAVTLAIQGRLKEAAGFWESAIEADPEWGVLYANLMKAATALRDEELAEKYLAGAIDAERFDPSSVLIYGGYLTERGKPARAARLYGLALERFPENPRLLYYEGIALAESDQEEKALASFQKAHGLAKAKPDFAEIVQPAEFEMFRLRFPGDEKDFQSARKLVFDQEDSGKKLKKNMEKAVKRLGPLIEKHPEFWNGYFVRGVAYRRMDDRDEARADFDRVLELFAEEPNTIMQLALLERDEHNFAKAAELAERAVKLAPRDPTHTVNAGLIMIEAGRCDEAWDLYNRTVKMVGEANAEVLRIELEARCKESRTGPR